MSERSTDLDVVVVMGMPRSGSTIVSRLLGEAEGVVCVGEVRHLWWHLESAPEHRCGCGELLVGCPFWGQVFERIGFDGTQAEASRRARVQERAVRRHHPYLGLPRLLRASAPPDDAGPFAQQLTELYRAAADVAGASVVVDSSKKSDYAALVSILPDVRTQVVHTLRDPRAVLMSHHARRHPDDPSASHPGDAARRSASWLLETAAARAVVRQRPNATTLEYDRFSRDPGRALGPILAAAGGDPATLAIEGSTATVGVDHTVGGSPTRFDTGTVEIRPDERWRTGLHPRDQRIATAVTFPLRHLHSARQPTS